MRVASDIVLNTLSTEGTAAVAYGIPVVHVVDEKFGEFPPDTMRDVPPAESGAAVLLEHVGDLVKTIEDLMDPESERSVSVHEAQQNHPLRAQRGKSAKNVAHVARRLLGHPAKA